MMRQVSVIEMKGMAEDPDLVMVQACVAQIADPDEPGVLAFVIGLRSLMKGDASWRSTGIITGGDRARVPGPKIYRRIEFVLSAIRSIFKDKTYNLMLWPLGSRFAEPGEMFIREFELGDKIYGPGEGVRAHVVACLRGEISEVARNRDTADA